ncbi:MAG: DNA polymerase IV [Verrucomicrobiota bacterium]
MSVRPNNRILHVDGDSFFASCEIALDRNLEGRPVWVGGGRRGDGIVIAANRHAKKFGVKTGMACFEAARICPRGVLCKPHYEEYRRLSLEMFRILEQYSPTLQPVSIDEGFLDFTTMDQTVWRNTTPADYVKGISQRISKEVGIPVSAGLASSSRLAKLATDAAKPGFLEIKPGEEKEFLKDRCVRDMSGIGKNRQRALAALGALTFEHVAKMPSHLLQKKFGIWGQQLWLFANGLWDEPLLLEVKDRTTISSNTTLPYDEPDYEAALTFTLSEATRLVGQLRREQMQTREVSLTIRFNDFSEVGGSHRFQHAQFQNSVINATLEGIFREIMSGPSRPVRQIRIAMWNLTRLDTQPTLWGRTDAERWGALDEATKKLQAQLGKTTLLLTGAQLALQKLDGVHKNPKAKCPFVPQREMVKKLWGTDADPLAHKSEWEQRLGKVSKQLQFNH